MSGRSATTISPGDSAESPQVVLSLHRQVVAPQPQVLELRFLNVERFSAEPVGLVHRAQVAGLGPDDTRDSAL
jgi:hypothetical protein